MKKTVLLVLLLTVQVQAQSIEGSFKNLKNNEITLKGYEGLDEKEIGKTSTDSLGNFKINYPAAYRGTALLQIKAGSNLIVLLNHEKFKMQWENRQDFNSLSFSNSPENDSFAEGIKVNQDTEQKLAGLKYLLPLYEKNEANESWLKTEINQQEKSFENFIATLPKASYVKSYLKLRKFLGDMQLTQERYKELNRVAQHEIAFTKIDFGSDALWHSGLLKEILSGYYQVLDLYQNEDSIAKHSIEANKVWLEALEKQPTKQQEVAEYCFTLLEKKGLVKASEQIALAMLNKDHCQLTDKQTDLFEQYRNLAIGKTAPNIEFSSFKGMSGGRAVPQKSLKDLKNAYKLVVFGASWCPNCQTDYPSLIGKYKNLKEEQDLEIVYLSIDTDKTAFESFYKEAPFITFCDTKGWKTQAAKDYHVFATPTYFLMDKDLKILAKVQSPEHLEEWFKSEK